MLCMIKTNLSHHYPRIEDFHDTLQVLHELDVARSDSTSPLPTGSSPTTFPRQDVSQPTIVIPPLDVDMMDSSTPIIYLLSSMGSIYLDSLGVSYICASFEPSSEDTLVSTLVDSTLTSHPSNPYDDVHVNHVSHDDY